MGTTLTKGCSDESVKCVDCTRVRAGDGSVVEVCDPAGAVFSETTDGLSVLDREVLEFCAHGNAVGARWLLTVGASANACDANKTSCLHAAARGGSLHIVEQLIEARARIDAGDKSQWQPIHVAAFIGRRDIVVALLQRGADPASSNERGQTALELCSDVLTKRIIQSFEAVQDKTPRSRVKDGFDWSNRHLAHDVRAAVARTAHFEPFFVPRRSVIQLGLRDTEVLCQYACTIFNQDAAYGLAILVATGCVRDYPVDLSEFIRKRDLDQTQLGHFLGEDFSIAQLLRLEFINSLQLSGTGIVGALCAMFMLLKMPPGFQRAARMVLALARIWWRQHDADSGDNSGALPSPVPVPELEECKGTELKQYLVSAEQLSQLMFSALLLHWNLHEPTEDGPAPRISLPRWTEINKSIEEAEIPGSVQRKVFECITQEHRQYLSFGPWRNAPVQRPARLPFNGLDRASTGILRDGVLESLLHVPHVWSESVGNETHRAAASAKSAWFELLRLVLFLFRSQTDRVPFAFLPLDRCQAAVCGSRLSITPRGQSGSMDLAEQDEGVAVVFLLPDARWQSIDVPKFEVEFDGVDQWRDALRRVGVPVEDAKSRMDDRAINGRETSNDRSEKLVRI